LSYLGQDGHALAELALKLKRATSTQTLVIISANGFDAQRLLEELPYFAPELTVNLLPDWETLPYDQFSPHPDLISERLTTLYQITQNACDVIIVPLSTALIRISPKAYLSANTFMLKKGQRLDTEALRLQCAEAGYHHVSQVISHGEFSVRGGLVDLFPMGSALPYRMDLFDDEIESIRTFDVDTQRSLYPVPEIRLLPAREFPLDEAGIALFRGQFRETFEGDPQRAKIYKDVSKGIASGGIEWYLPLFFEKTACLLDYLNSQSVLCLHGDLDHSAQQFWREAQVRYKTLAHDAERPLLPPESLLFKAEDFFASTHAFARIVLSIDGPSNGLPALDIERRAEQPLHKLQAYLADFAGRVLITAESLGRRETIDQLFKEQGLNPALITSFADFTASNEKFMLGVSPLHHGMVLSANGTAKTKPDAMPAGGMSGRMAAEAAQSVAIITEAELYAATVRQQRRRE
jgi:transcription-repair coupling factor (superfamily II helicase)